MELPFKALDSLKLYTLKFKLKYYFKYLNEALSHIFFYIYQSAQTLTITIKENEKSCFVATHTVKDFKLI